MVIINIPKDAKLPLLGLIQIGIIDRGSNLLQIRPTTLCNLNCAFCSTNPMEKNADYTIDCKYLIEQLKETIKLKQDNQIEANIDSVGETTTYKDIVRLVVELKSIPEIKFISMQTNGTLLNKKKIAELENAGLNRINLSIHTLDSAQAKALSQNKDYDIEKIKETTKIIAKSRIEIIITPVWLPKINDSEIPKLISFAKEISAKIAIQKYEKYRYGKRCRIKPMNWFKFYRQLTKWEREFNIKLKYGPVDFGIHKTRKLPLTMQKGEIVIAEIACNGWLKGEMVATANNRSITVLKTKKQKGDKIKLKILENKNNIYITREI